MGTTANYAFPYPELIDPPDGPAQIKALAEKIDTVIKNGIAAVQTGTFTGGPTASNVFLSTITFPKAFANTPVMSTNINSQSGTTNFAISRASPISATGFTFYTLNTAGSAMTFSQPLQWTAILPATTPVQRTVPPPEDGWHYVTATCHNPQCPNDGITISYLMIPDDPAMPGWQGVTCGACGQPITDVVPMA